jgi:hypothetical protein
MWVRRSGRQLAEAGGVSAMSASRFLRQLSSEGFLDESKEPLRLVRVSVGLLISRIPWVLLCDDASHDGFRQLTRQRESVL